MRGPLVPDGGANTPPRVLSVDSAVPAPVGMAFNGRPFLLEGNRRLLNQEKCVLSAQNRDNVPYLTATAAGDTGKGVTPRTTCLRAPRGWEAAVGDHSRVA